MTEAPRVFFSYASEDGFWVEAFKNSTAFKSIIGQVRIFDYAAEEVGYGPLGAALDEQINQSTVVIAFVSSDYCKKKWTVAEWEESLTEAQRRLLVFVPIMLDVDATAWWQDLRKQGKLSALSGDYAYVNFTNASGGRLDIRPEDTQVNGKIARLARQIRDDLETGPCAPICPANKPLPPATLDAAEVVVLAHPKAALTPEMAKHAAKLCGTLKGRGMRVDFWDNEWRRKPEARGKVGVNAETVFVQPLSEGEAADMASDPGATGAYLVDAGFPSAKVVLWLPPAFHEPPSRRRPRRAPMRGRFPFFASMCPTAWRIG